MKYAAGFLSLSEQVAAAGKRRQDIHRRLDDNKATIQQILLEADEAALSISRIAELAGVSRQTLYRWLDEVGRADQ